jgi:hypothetical protein
VSLVEEYAIDDAFHSLVDRCIRENDVGRLAAEFECVIFAGTRDGALDEAPDFR